MQNFIKTIINGVQKRTKKEIRDNIKNSVADWNQNDASAVDYVKNRTHWSDGIVEEVILERQIVSSQTDIICKEIINGQTYKVIFDNQIYECVAWDDGYLGNGDIIEIGESGNEPFVIVDNCRFYTFESGEHTIEITRAVENIHKLDSKYLDLNLDVKMDKNNPTGAGSFSMYGTGWFQDSLRVGGTNPQSRNAKNVLLEGDALKLDNIHISLPYTNGDWSNIAYGNNKFVAVSGSVYDSNVAAYSEDGITWIQTTIPKYQWNSVAYGDGKFVAVGGNGEQGMYSCAAYSEDGINWIELDVYGDTLYSIVYGDGKFVAVGKKGTIIYSEDGMNWRSPTITLNQNTWQFVTYGHGAFVAVGYGVNGTTTQHAIYSTNGIDWIQTNLPDSSWWNSVAYGDGKFVAVSGGYVSTTSNIAAYSEDGLNWTKITLPSNNYWHYITYGERKFIIRNQNLYGAEDAMLYSEDGINWNPINVLNVVSNRESLSYINNKFMTICRKNTDIFIQYSYDGLTWYDTYEAFTQNNKDITDKVRDLVLSISPIQIGQTIVVKSIDDTGKPTEWEAVDPFVLTDENTGVKYKLSVVNGILTMTEVTS